MRMKASMKGAETDTEASVDGKHAQELPYPEGISSEEGTNTFWL